MASALNRTYRELPPATYTSEALPDWIRAVLNELEQGVFWRAAQLAERMGRDDRVSGVLGTRVNALLGLPMRFEPRGDGRRGAAVASAAEQDWTRMFPEDELKQLVRWGILLGIGIAEQVWDTSDPARWRPRLKVWHPQFLTWRWETESYWLSVRDGQQVEVKPGDPKWVIFAPYGHRRGWMQALVRPLAMPWIMRQLAFRDWARYSEVHGLPTRVGTVPNGSDNPADREKFEDQLFNLGSESVLLVSKDDQGRGYDFELVEAKGNSHEGFRAHIEKCDESIAVAVLGQNLTTAMKTGGSYAAANVHDRVRQEYVEADARATSAALRDQVLKPWAWFNFGDEELAPYPRYVTDAPEDRKATADTLKVLGEAAKTLRDAGAELDLVEMARRFNVPLKVTESPPAPAPEPKEEP